MTGLWLAVKASSYARWLVMAGGVILAVLTFGQIKKREGRAEERASATEAKLKKTEEMRNAANNVDTDRDALADRLRDRKF